MEGALTALMKRLKFARSLRSRRFALLWIGQTISAVGDGAFFTALAWKVLLLTGSGTAMGVALVAESVPLVAFMLIGGVVADRLPRRLTMLWSDGGRAAVALTVAALGLLHLLQFWHLLALAFLFGFAEAFFRPAYQSLPPELVVPEDLPSANALTGFSRNVSQLVGPAIGAALVAASSASLAFAFDGLTFAVSALFLFLMGRVSARAVSGEAARPAVLAEDTPLPELGAVELKTLAPGDAPRRGMRGVVADIREGITYITGSTWLWFTIALASVGNVGLAPLQVALPRLVRDTYHQGVWLLGAILTASAIGSIVSSLVMGQLGRMRRRGLIAYASLILVNVAEIAFGLPLVSALAPGAPLAAGVLIGVGLGVFEVLWVTILQELVPADKLGRVSSVDWMGSLSLQPIGLGLVGVLTDAVGPAWVFILGGALNLLLSLIGLLVPSVRNLD